jgi:fructose-bisphosphate aldolase, class II
MSLANLAELASGAARSGLGLGAFNVIHLEHATMFCAAAEEAGRPVVLQISENAVKYHGALEPILSGTLAVARASSAPVVVHLDHAESPDLVRRAVELGVQSVMFDGSRLPDEENIALTAELAAWCHERGVGIEAELGEVGGKSGVHAPGARTDPDDAARFVDATGVDLLAVAVGSSHAMSTRDAVLDLELIAVLKESVPVPLVLHGSSGVSDEGMQAAIRAGMTKINVSTHVNKVFTETIRVYLDEHPGVVDSRKYFTAASTAVVLEVGRLLRLYAS